MAYSRQLKLAENVERSLIDWLDQELFNSEAERGQFVDRILRYQQDYWAEPKQEIRTFPFRGAASIVIPLTAIATEAVHARVMTMLFGLPQFVTIKSKSDEWEPHVRGYEKYLDWELLHNLSYRDNIESAMLELIKHGTGVAKINYCRQYKWIVREVENGNEEEIPVLIKQGADVGTTPLTRFLVPFYARKKDDAPWVAEEHEWTLQQMQGAVDAGLIEKWVYDKLKAFVDQGAEQTHGDRAEIEEQIRTRTLPVWKKTITFHEIYTRFDIGENRRLIEIVVGFHRPTRTLMYIRHNRDVKGNDPWEIGKYFPLEHRWFGIGIAKQSEQFQKEITTQHRQRLDAGTIANMQMFKVSKLSGYGPKEPIFPGKMWFLDDMSHVEMMTMNDVKVSSFSNENQSLTFFQQRSGINELTLGMPHQGTPSTASDALSRVEEGRRKFDYIYANVKDFNKRVITKVAAAIQQYGPKRVEYFTQNEDGNLTQQIIEELPVSSIYDSLIFDISSAGEQQNKLIDRQNWIAVSQIVSQVYTQLITMAQSFGQQEDLIKLYNQAKIAAMEILKQILASYDIRNEERIVVKEFLNALNKPTNEQPGAEAAQLGGLQNPIAALQSRGLANSPALSGVGSTNGSGPAY